MTFDPPVIAHRGASAYAPENTFASFKKAKALGAAWIEFDVMLTACGEVVVFHDETLERTTNGKGSLSERSYDELKILDAGSWFDPAFSQEKIPRLKDVLLWLADCPLCVNIELKALPGKENELVQKVLFLVSQYWPSHIFPPLYSSFSTETLRELRKQSSQALLGFLMDEFYPESMTIAQALSCSTMHINHKNLNADHLEKLKKTGLPILCYTVNHQSRAMELFDLGVMAIFSDYPNLLRKP